MFASRDGCKTQCEVLEYMISEKIVVKSIMENGKTRRYRKYNVAKSKFNRMVERMLKKYGHYFKIVTMKPVKTEGDE